MITGPPPRDAATDDRPQGVFVELELQIRQLLAEAVDYDDPAVEADHYARAAPIIEATIRAPADRLADLEVKALAMIWCMGGLPITLGPSTSERVASSILNDLTNGCRRRAATGT